MHQGDGFFSHSGFRGQDPYSTGHVVIIVVNLDECVLDLRVTRKVNTKKLGSVTFRDTGCPISSEKLHQKE